MLNGIENVKIMKTVCEKVVYEGLLVSLMFLKVKKNLYLFYLFQCEKKERAVSPTYCTEVGKGRSPVEPVSRARLRRAGRGKPAGRGE